MPGLNPFASAWVPPNANVSAPSPNGIATSEPLSILRSRPVQGQGSNKRAVDVVPKEVPPCELHKDEFEDPLFHDDEHPATCEGDSDSIGDDSDSPATTLSSGEAEECPIRGHSHAEVHVDEQLNVKALAKLQMEIDSISDQPVQCSAGAGSLTSKVGLQDFQLVALVGQGAFGKVFQVRYKKTNQIFAMKVMRKERILERDHSEYVKSERDLLTAVDHPYIVALRYAFQTSSKLYLILDFLNGGHLFFNLYREGVFSEDVARLYTAEIVSAISYLHSKNIMHRDLKPENVLLDTEGHIRLTDFGLAKGEVTGENERSNSFIGTMEYMAPEIVDSKGHTMCVDWWSTGILLYEMLCGIPPFRAKSRKVLQEQILQAKAKYPKFLSTDAQNLLKGLLTRDPAKRLGSGAGGADAIKKHPFFKTINWAKLERREIVSKFRPTVKCSQSVENFDKIWTDQPPEDSPCCTPNASHVMGVFHGFSYVSPSFMLNAQPLAAEEAKAANNA